MHIFSPTGKSMHIFSPIDFKFTKLHKKKARGANPINISNFIRGKNKNQEGGGGQKYEFQI